MEKEENKKRVSCEDNILSEYEEKLNDIKSGKSKFFYFCLLILNVCMILLVFIWLNNTRGINCIELLGQVWDTKIFIIMIAIFLLMGVLYTIPNFLKLFHKQKQRKFGTLYKAHIVEKYYESVTIAGKGGKVVSSDYMIKSGISKQNALSLTHGSGVINRLSILAISLLMLVIGAFSWVENIHVLLYLIALFGVIFEIFYIVFLMIFAKNKKKGLSLLARFCKLLFNMKLLKDYESAYNKMIDYAQVKSSIFKQNKALMITEIASQMLIYMLRIVILYLGLYTISSKTTDRLWVLAFGFIVLDVIINILPLQKGTIIVEVLFVWIFSIVFTDTYVFFGLLIYKIFEYFMHALMFAIIWLVDKIFYSVKNKSTNKKKVEKDMAK